MSSSPSSSPSSTTPREWTISAAVEQNGTNLNGERRWRKAASTKGDDPPRMRPKFSLEVFELGDRNGHGH
jgi:hypothetical protein